MGEGGRGRRGREGDKICLDALSSCGQAFLNKEVCTLTLLAQLNPFFLTLLTFVGYLVTAMRRVTNARTCRKLGPISVASQRSGSVTEEGQENHNVTVTPWRKCDTKPEQREDFTRLTQSYRLILVPWLEIQALSWQTLNWGLLCKAAIASHC